MSRAALARFAGLCLLWGSSFLFIKVALDGLSPTQVVLARVTSGAMVLLAVVALRRQGLPRSLRVWGHLAVIGVVGNVVPFTLIAFATERIPTGLAGLLNGTTPLFTMAFAVAALSEERLRATRAAGFLVGFAGVAIVVGPGGLTAADGSIGLAGPLASLAGAASYGVAFVYTRHFVAGRGVPALALAAAQLSCAAVTLWLLAPVLATSPIELSLPVVASIVALGGLGTGVAYILYYSLISEVGATTTSMVTYLIPVVAVTLGVVVLGEALSPTIVLGGAVVIFGVALAEGRIGRRPPTVDAPLAAPRR